MAHDNNLPSAFVMRFASLVPAGARVLDLAAGSGRHARYFAARGVQVVAVDRDAAALSAIAGFGAIETRVVDLEGNTWPLDGERFDAIVVTNYLHRPTLQRVREALTPGGVLLYETFAIGNERYGRPTNPDFLLREGELLAWAQSGPAPLVVVAFEQGRAYVGERSSVVSRLAAVGPDYPWPPALAAP